MFSALLHGIILAVVLFFMMPAKQREPLVPPSVFLLLPGTASLPSSGQANPALRPVTFTPPLVPAHVETPPAEETVAALAPTPAPVHTPAVRHPPAIVPATSERAPPTHTTIEQFRKRHPVTTTATSANPVKPTRIDLGTILEPAGPRTSSESSPSASDVREADAYLSRLLAKLRAAHQKPPGLDAGLRVRVEFSLRADGSLADVRLIESSGNGEFDESVLAAFRKAADFGALPHGFGKTHRVTFRTDAEGG